MSRLGCFPHRCLYVLVVGSLFAAWPAPPTDAQVSGDAEFSVESLRKESISWRDLFDGQTLDGWTQRGGQASYTVENGEIKGATRPHTPNSFLCTDDEFGDFMLAVEFRVHPRLNSGIQIRSESKPSYRNGRVHGYQVEIDPGDRAWTAGIYDEARRGWLRDLTHNNRARYAFRQDKWNHLLIVCEGPSIETWLNGIPAASLKDETTSSGFIALQVHGVGGRQDPISIRFRNIRICTDPQQFKHHQTVARKSVEGLFREPAAPTRIATEMSFSEGPSLGPGGDLYWSDIPASRVLRYSIATEQLGVAIEDSHQTNGTYWTANDALICCESGARRISRRDSLTSQPSVLADKYEGQRLNSPNDLTLDTQGGIYFTDPRYGNRSDMEMDVEGVYFIDRGRKLSRVIGDLVRPNGLVLSHDAKTLYVADHGDGKIWKYDVLSPGKLANRQLVADIGSDGMTIDERGNIYATWSNHVYIFSPKGDELGKIEFPTGTTNVTFGGPGNRTLFVTAGPDVYSMPMQIGGGRAWANPSTGSSLE